jgi:hypothetical protein
MMQADATIEQVEVYVHDSKPAQSAIGKTSETARQTTFGTNKGQTIVNTQ